jgi:hypothetical protein
MTAILAERQRRRREQVEKAEEVHTSASKRDKAALHDAPGGANANSKSLQSLVESVKRKSANSDSPGVGKRRKL